VNVYGAWMDSESATITFQVTGAHGEAAVMFRGYDCFEVEMVHGGELVDVTDSIVCP
jgi:hypothetical protein